jgi:S-adenosylhomocysteine hydrolase
MLQVIRRGLWMALLQTKYLPKCIYTKRNLLKSMMMTKKQELIKVEVLPKKLDEEVAAYMVEGFGGVMTKLSSEQADYLNVPEEGPFKSEIYKY